MFFIVCLVYRFTLILAHFPDFPKDYKDAEINKIEIPRDITTEAVNDTDYELIAPTLPPRLVDIILSEMVEPSRPNNRYETFAAILNRHHLTDEEKSHLKLMDPYWLYSNKLGQFVPDILGLPKDSEERGKLQEYLWGPMTSTLITDITLPSIHVNDPNYDHFQTLFNYSITTPTYFRIGPEVDEQQIINETSTNNNHVFANLSVSTERSVTDQVPTESVSPVPNIGDTVGGQLPSNTVPFTSDNPTNGSVSDSLSNGNLSDSVTTGVIIDSVTNGNISYSVASGNTSDSVTSGTASNVLEVVTANITTLEYTKSIITPSPSVTVTPATVDDFPGYPDAEPGGQSTTEQILYILSVPSTVTTEVPLLELDAEVNDEEHAVITKDGLGMLGKDWVYNDASPSTMPDNIVFDPILPMEPQSPPSMADELNSYVREHGVGIFSAFLQKFLDMYAEKNYNITKAMPRQVSIHFLYPYNARDLQIFDEFQSDFSDRFLEFTGTVMAMTKPEQFQRLAIMSKDLVRDRRAILSGELNDLIDRLDKGYESDDAPKFINILEAIHGYPENNVTMAKIVMHIADDVFFNGYRSLKQPEDRKFVALTLYKYILLFVKPNARKNLNKFTKNSGHFKISKYFTGNFKPVLKLTAKHHPKSMVHYSFKNKNELKGNFKKSTESTRIKSTFFKPAKLTKKVRKSDRYNKRIDMINNIKSIKYRLKTKQITRNNVNLHGERLIPLDKDDYVIMNSSKNNHFHRKKYVLKTSTCHNKTLAIKAESSEYFNVKQKSTKEQILGTTEDMETQITKYNSETVTEYTMPEKLTVITTPKNFEAKITGDALKENSLKDTIPFYTKEYEYFRNTDSIKTSYNAKLADITARSSNSDEELLLRSKVRAAMFGRRNNGGIEIPNSLSDDEPIIKMNLYKALGVIYTDK